jgi:hypothetical protein
MSATRGANVLAIACTVATACSSESQSPPTTAKPATSTRPTLAADCKRAFDEKPAPDLTPDQLERFHSHDSERVALEKLCIDDQWSTAATECFAKATPQHGVSECFDGFSGEQKEHFWRVVRETETLAKPSR